MLIHGVLPPAYALQAYPGAPPDIIVLKTPCNDEQANWLDVSEVQVAVPPSIKCQLLFSTGNGLCTDYPPDLSQLA